MANLEWSPEDVENFRKFANSQGVEVLKIEGPDLRGDYIFHMRHGSKPVRPNLVEEFERSRHGKK